jgi:two-component system, NarL family, sensor histidine kinase UhpB
MKPFRLWGLLLAGLNMWFYWRVMGPLRQLTSSAQKLSQGDLTALEQGYPAAPQIEGLRTAMNAMVGHVRRAQAQERTYIQALTSGQEAERARIARELHDDTTQSLIAIAQSLEIAQGLIGADTPASTLLKTARSQAIEAVNNLRVLIANLRPPSLAELGLISALHLLAEGTQDTQVMVEAIGKVRRLNEMQELALFRSAQEALWNAQRHGQAKHVDIQLVYDDDKVQITMQDDGIGFVPPQDWLSLSAAGHYGLVGIYERIQLLGGTFQLNSTPGIGTRIQISIPLQKILQPGDVVRDPVCSAVIQPHQAYANVAYKGAQYYFCCPVCQGAFQANPEVYLCEDTR